MWDNRRTLHQGTDYDDPRWMREMHRATVSDVANSCEQGGIAVPVAGHEVDGERKFKNRSPRLSLRGAVGDETISA